MPVPVPTWGHSNASPFGEDSQPATTLSAQMRKTQCLGLWYTSNQPQGGALGVQLCQHFGFLHLHFDPLTLDVLNHSFLALLLLMDAVCLPLQSINGAQLLKLLNAALPFQKVVPGCTCQCCLLRGDAIRGLFLGNVLFKRFFLLLLLFNEMIAFALLFSLCRLEDLLSRHILQSLLLLSLLPEFALLSHKLVEAFLCLLLALLQLLLLLLQPPHTLQSNLLPMLSHLLRLHFHRLALLGSRHLQCMPFLICKHLLLLQFLLLQVQNCGHLRFVSV
mmetsp:Transcript_34217/g.57142  ORF Transcript_34217/g.57142 Transcript_34217/m.57142 type:complete len:276 (-) Transcript_34217:694-1521(-)